ncbi:MAG: hypothetical protein K0R57_988 [Paenibacillaceae bacterium]|jgi:hypothetical protein|nr:hypothetical protein [Paenibacillaceae bacterium]
MPITPAKSRRGSALLGLSAAVLLFLLIGAFFAAETTEDMPPYLSFSADDDGLKAIRTLMSRKAESVNEWRKSWNALPAGQENVLLSAAPDNVEEGEGEPLAEWIARGNHLIVLDQELPPHMGFPGVDSIVPEPENAASPGVVPVVRYAASGGQEKSGMAEAPRTKKRLKETPEARMLLSDSRGGLAARYAHGQGSVTVLLAPEWLINEAAAREEHFELVWPILLDAIQGRHTWFDEYHHGYRAERGITEVYPAWLLAVYVQAALAVVLWLVRKGKRFGPVHIPREWVVRRGDETLAAVAGWYKRRKLRNEAIREQEQYLRQLLQERWGVRLSAPIEEVVQSARIHGGAELGEQLESLLVRLGELNGGKRYSDKAFLADCAAMAHIVEAAERKGGEKEWKD